MKNFSTLGVHWKIELLGGGSRKNNIEGGDCLKWGAWTVCWFKGGAWQERGGGVLEWGGVDTPMHTKSYPKIIWHVLIQPSVIASNWCVRG